jgi:hypothetical protein
MGEQVSLCNGAREAQGIMERQRVAQCSIMEYESKPTASGWIIWRTISHIKLYWGFSSGHCVSV